jgi:DNA-binding SARP family transcriptional activator
MAHLVEFRLLGALEVVIAGRPVILGGRRQQVVLATLLVSHPYPVSSDRLIDAVWGDHPPPTAPATLQAYVSRLRKLLAAAGVGLQSGARGYRLEIDDDAIDACRFDRAVDNALALSQDRRNAEIIDLLEPALGMWRSAHAFGPLRDAGWAVEFSARLTERRLVAEELLADAYLELGKHLAAAIRLERALTEWPLSESLAKRYMLALYRGGRQVDALAVYERIRLELKLELGLEPSAELREFHHAVLNQSAGLDWRPASARQLVRVLPPRNPLFTGREELVRTVRRHLATNGVVTIHGLGGVGKTDVALEIAHLHAGPVSWITAESRTSLFGALTSLGRRLNVQLGSDEADLLSGLWAAMSEREDWLLVFDNAEDLELVREALPPLTTVRVLITSQSPAWAALGPTIRVDPFGPTVAVRFLLTRSGRRDPQAATTLADLLGNLPLALEQAGAYVDQTGLSLAEYLRLFHLRRDQLLMRGAPANHRQTVSATWQIVFERVRARSPLAARILETSAFMAPDAIPLSWISAIVSAQVDEEMEFADAVAELLRYSLVDRGEGNLRVHRLVQAVLRAKLPAEQRVTRATDVVTLLRRVAPPVPTDPDGWTTWAVLAPHITALLKFSEDLNALPTGLVALALDAFRYLRARSALPSAHSILDLLIVVGHATSADRRLLGELYAERGELLDAEGKLILAREELERAITLMGGAADAGDLPSARTLARLAHLVNCAGEPDRAVEYYQRCLPVLRELGDTAEIVRTLIGLGYTYWALDAFATGATQFHHALEILDQAGWAEHPLAAEAMSGLGMMLHDQGRPAESRDLQRRALAVLHLVYGEVDHPIVAEVHDKLGWTLRLLGDLEGARAEHAESAAMMSRQFGLDDPRVAMALTNLGLAELEAGDIGGARAHQQRAYEALLRAYGPDHCNTRLVVGRLEDLDRRSVASVPGR